MPYSKQDILTQNINTYPNNNSGQITPDSVKTFNQNFIDSVQFTDTPTPQAVSASYAQNATSASQAANAVSSSFATTASYALVAEVVLQGTVSSSYALSASYAAFATTASHALNVPDTASYALQAQSSSYATTASFALNVPATASFAVSASQAISASYASYSNNLVSDVQQGLLSQAIIAVTKGGVTSNFTVNNVNNATSASYADTVGNIDFSTLVNTASFNAYTSSAATTFATKTELNAYTGSTNTFTSSIQAQVNGLQSATSSYVKNAQTSSMSVLSASYASYSNNLVSDVQAGLGQNQLTVTKGGVGSTITVNNVNNATSASFADLANNIVAGANISASNITVANNLTVNGTASFAYTKTTTGSAVIIGDSFIILNADTPTAPFAGIMVYDTGSVNATASFEWNGNNDYWILVEETGASAGILTGASGSKGFEVFPGLNKLTKGTGNNTIINSNISDNGSIVSINSNTQVTGSLVVSAGITGSLNGTASFANNATSASFAAIAGTVTTASFATSASYANTAQLALSINGANVAGPVAQATSASYALSASFATSASIARTALTASSVSTLNQTVTITNGLQLSGSITGSTVLGNWTDTFTSSPVVSQVVSLTQAEYNSVSASANAANTLYLITDAITIATSASYATFAQTAGTATTASYVASVVSASFATSASSAITASFANSVNNVVTDIATTLAQDTFQFTKNGTNTNITINNVANATSAGSANTAISASFASTAAAAQTATSASYAQNASNAITASYAQNAGASFPYTGNAEITGGLNVQNTDITSTNLVTNQYDSFTSSAKIYSIVSCTYAEYLSVSGSADAAYTLYIVSDSPAPTPTTTTSTTTTTTTVAPVLTNLLTLVDASNGTSWPGSGTTWYDISGNSKNATLVNGLTYSTAGGAPSMYFDGVNDYATFGNGNITLGSMPVTFNFWFKGAAAYPNQPDGMYDSGPGLGNVLRNIDGIAYGGATNYPTAEWSGQNPFVSLTEASGSYTVTDWNQYTFVYNYSTNRSLKWYMNGSLKATVTGNTSATYNFTELVFGAINKNDFWLNGYMNVAGVYDIALSDAQVLQNYNAYKSRFGL